MKKYFGMENNQHNKMQDLFKKGIFKNKAQEL